MNCRIHFTVLKLLALVLLSCGKQFVGPDVIAASEFWHQIGLASDIYKHTWVNIFSQTTVLVHVYSPWQFQIALRNRLHYKISNSIQNLSICAHYHFVHLCMENDTLQKKIKRPCRAIYNLAGQLVINWRPRAHWGTRRMPTTIMLFAAKVLAVLVKYIVRGGSE